MFACQNQRVKFAQAWKSLFRAKMDFDNTTKTSMHTQYLTDQERLIWVDLEMTGLEIKNDHIIEMSCLVTDHQLQIIAEGPSLIIHQSEEVMSQMNPWCVDHHGKSGLTTAVAASRITLQQAEMEMLSFVRLHTPRGKCPLAGNSIHVDKKFLDKHMPRFLEHCHYRIVDVSTIKELCRRWYPDIFQRAPQKKFSHRTLDDIKDSINELQYYRRAIFIPSSQTDNTVGMQGDAPKNNV